MPATNSLRRSAPVVAALACLVAVGPAPAWAAPADATTATAATTCEHACILNARTGAHPDFDRLVFDLTDGGLPPTVRADVSPGGSYSPGATGEIRKLLITGMSYLLLDMSPADARSTGPDAYTTPTVQSVSLPSLKGIQMTGSYEGHTTFGLSLGDYSQYKAFTLAAPNRVVIDVYH
ncbi:hypothetical protein ACGFRG_00160 [Streptomyces sp. NPDC048696]|uniref:AMIN-like domain-containing (lipo)protein n=1 Tax=Streptomyces sp. NPDC048696 TaxID=3365585 RepID=UPI00371E2CAA